VAGPDGPAGAAQPEGGARRAPAEEREYLNALFAELCAIPSPSGDEQACAQRVSDELTGLGLQVETDDFGNLLARVPGSGAGHPILLCAHLDTVPHGDVPIEPVLVDEGWENANRAILGADNKAAVAVMLAAARRAVAAPLHHGIELLFTLGEETALLGAKAFDPARLTAPYGYVYDHASPIGEIVVASPTYYKLEAEFHGKAAHAGIRPEDGRNAIVAAAKAIASIPSGRIDAETTTNVAGISGGRPHTNVVPDQARFWAEARSLDAQKAHDQIAHMVDRIHDAANDPVCDVDVDVDVEKLFTGYRHEPGAPQVAKAARALRACGYTPSHITTGGGSDANALEARGFPCTNLANGTERNHEITERVSVAALEGMLDVTFALLEDPT
jgi:tripeptide aminopeptidase